MQGCWSVEQRFFCFAVFKDAAGQSQPEHANRTSTRTICTDDHPRCFQCKEVLALSKIHCAGTSSQVSWCSLRRDAGSSTSEDEKLHQHQPHPWAMA